MRQSSSDGLYNIITFVFVGLTLFVCIIVALMLTKTIQPPLSFRPITPTFPATKAIPSETPTPTATLTPLPSNTPIPTSTLRPSNTPTETPTETWTPFPTDIPLPTDPPPPTAPEVTDIPIETEPFPTPDPNVPPAATATPAGFPFALQEGSPALIPNVDEATGCSFQGVGGQVWGMQGEPILNLQVVVTTSTGLSQTVLTGSNLRFGESGWVVQHDVRPTIDTYTVQLLDPNGVPVSDIVQIPFPGTCEQNLALLNFAQTRPY